MRMYHKQQESNLGAICLFSPVAEARDSLRKLDASKDKGRVLGGVSHWKRNAKNIGEGYFYYKG
jgi:hypothetical protein